jgi:hypothetical protein
MRPTDVDVGTDALYGALRAADPDVMDGDELAILASQVARMKAWCDALQVRATRRQRALAAEGRAGAPRDTFSRHGGQSAKDAKSTEDREAVCSSMPGFESALSSGVVSAGHVDAIAAATRNLDGVARAEFAAQADELLSTAAESGVDAFARNCRDRAREIQNRVAGSSEADELERQRAASKISRWVDRETGMHKTLIELDPVSDREFWSAVQHQRGVVRARTVNRQVSWDRLTVDALLECVSSGSATGRRVPSIRVHISLDRLLSDIGNVTLCETDSGDPIPAETVRRLACEADLIPMVFNGAGVILDEGRTKRLATAEQRAAIEAMQRTCAHPDCTVTIDDCRIHHVTFWREGGKTDLADIVGICEQHHHLVHEGGWSLTMTPDRLATWTRPDGTTYWTGPTHDRTLVTA